MRQDYGTKIDSSPLLHVERYALITTSSSPHETPTLHIGSVKSLNTDNGVPFRIILNLTRTGEWTIQSHDSSHELGNSHIQGEIE